MHRMYRWLLLGCGLFLNGFIKVSLTCRASTSFSICSSMGLDSAHGKQQSAAGVPASGKLSTQPLQVSSGTTCSGVGCFQPFALGVEHAEDVCFEVMLQLFTNGPFSVPVVSESKQFSPHCWWIWEVPLDSNKMKLCLCIAWGTQIFNYAQCCSSPIKCECWGAQ